MEIFSIEQQTQGELTIVRCKGRFDAHTMTEVKPVLEAATEHAPANLLVNLAEVSFVDSSALAALVSGMKRARQHGGDLTICGLQKSVRIIFELTRLDRAFTIVEDEATALAAAA